MNKLAAAAAARVIKDSGVRSRSMCSGARSNNQSNSVKETKPGLPETVSPEVAAMLQAAREEGILQERARLLEIASSFPARRKPLIPLENRSTLAPYILIPAITAFAAWITETLFPRRPSPYSS